MKITPGNTYRVINGKHAGKKFTAMNQEFMSNSGVFYVEGYVTGDNRRKVICTADLRKA